MKEIHEFRIFEDRYHLLPKNNAEYNGSIYILHIAKEDPLFDFIGKIDRERRTKGDMLAMWAGVKRIYTPEEISQAKLFQLIIKPYFEPAGEECGTEYDETVACDICGTHRKQITPLKLKKGSIPKKDAAQTIANEIVVSKRFMDCFAERGLKGISFSPVYYAKGISDYSQPVAKNKLIVSSQTQTGISPFDFSERSKGIEFTVSGGYPVKFEPEVYKCPKGDNIGANLLSEVYIKDSPIIQEFDYFETEQTIGGKQGLLRPHPILLCSPAFRNMVIEEKLKRFDFEVAHIVTE
jgi:hypothetical protein